MRPGVADNCRASYREQSPQEQRSLRTPEIVLGVQLSHFQQHLLEKASPLSKLFSPASCGC